MNKEILKAQLDLYMKGRQQALETLEKAKTEVIAFNGAIEACGNLLRLEEELTAGNHKQPFEAVKETITKEA